MTGKRPTNWWPARATDGTVTRAEAALRADTRRRLCGYSVCRTAEVLVRADQPAGPSAVAMARARASSSRSVPARRARSCWAASCRWAPGRRWASWRALRLPDSDRAARRRDPHPRDGAPVTASPSACSGPTPLEHRSSRRLQHRDPHLAHRADGPASRKTDSPAGRSCSPSRAAQIGLIGRPASSGNCPATSSAARSAPMFSSPSCILMSAPSRLAGSRRLGGPD